MSIAFSGRRPPPPAPPPPLPPHPALLKTSLDLDSVATCVYTPCEYASFGLSEEEARDRFGPELEVFHAAWDTTETSLVDAFCDAEGEIGVAHGAEEEEVEGERIYPQECYAKAVCVREGSASDDDNDNNLTIVGLHLAGPMAGEVVQGFAAAHRSHRRRQKRGERYEWTGGLPKSALDDCIGIHPTLAEGLVQGALSASKNRGESPEKTSC